MPRRPWLATGQGLLCAVAHASFGAAMQPLEDFNGDGYGDIAIGAPAFADYRKGQAPRGLFQVVR